MISRIGERIRSRDGRDPHGHARKIDVMKKDGAARDHG